MFLPLGVKFHLWVSHHGESPVDAGDGLSKWSIVLQFTLAMKDLSYPLAVMIHGELEDTLMSDCSAAEKVKCIFV